MGCGRGAVLMLAARRLPAGRAVGADVWRRRDQSGNSRAAQLDWRTWYGLPGHHIPLVAAARPPG